MEAVLVPTQDGMVARVSGGVRRAEILDITGGDAARYSHRLELEYERPPRTTAGGDWEGAGCEEGTEMRAQFVLGHQLAISVERVGTVSIGTWSSGKRCVLGPSACRRPLMLLMG